MAAFPVIRLASPVSVGVGFNVLFANAGNFNREFRKLRSPYPRRMIQLTYENISVSDARSLWQFYLTCQGPFQAFNYFFERSDTYVKEYVGTGDGTTTTFGLPSKHATSRSVYLDNVLTGTGFTFHDANGSDGEDTIVFTTAPASAKQITFSFTGYLRVRTRFADNMLNFDVFYRFLVSLGIKLQGLLLDE